MQVIQCKLKKKKSAWYPDKQDELSPIEKMLLKDYLAWVNGSKSSLSDILKIWIKAQTNIDVDSTYFMKAGQSKYMMKKITNLQDDSTKIKSIYVNFNAKVNSIEQLRRLETLRTSFINEDVNVRKSLINQINESSNENISVDDLKTFEDKVSISNEKPLTFTTTSKSVFKIGVKKGWNLVGSSLNCSINDEKNLIIPNSIYEYDESYKNTSEIRLNKGYWINCNDSGIIEFNYNEDDIHYQWTEIGISKIKENKIYDYIINHYEKPEIEGGINNEIFSVLLRYNYKIEDLLSQKMIKIKDIEITLNKGWNLIGASYNSNIIDTNNIIIPNAIYEYETSYKSTNEIKENKGYWIKAKENGNISLNIV